MSQRQQYNITSWSSFLTATPCSRSSSSTRETSRVRRREAKAEQRQSRRIAARNATPSPTERQTSSHHLRSIITSHSLPSSLSLHALHDSLTDERLLLCALSPCIQVTAISAISPQIISFPMQCDPGLPLTWRDKSRVGSAHCVVHRSSRCVSGSQEQAGATRDAHRGSSSAGGEQARCSGSAQEDARRWPRRAALGSWHCHSGCWLLSQSRTRGRVQEDEESCWRGGRGRVPSERVRRVGLLICIHFSFLHPRLHLLSLPPLELSQS